MDKKQSLRDLQDRLSQRLTAAKSERTTLASWLAIAAGEMHYLIPLVQSGEIYPWAPPQVLPYTKSWYAGVLPLRGGLHGVINIAKLIAQTKDNPLPIEQITPEASLIGLHSGFGIDTVFWVDQLIGLRNPSMFHRVMPPNESAIAFFARRLIDHKGLVWQEIDFRLLVSSPEFLEIAL